MNKNTILAVIVALGIVYGDIGTSPLYVMKAIIGGNKINDLLIRGSLSCVFWTLTLQTTVKYVIIVLRVDRKGQGGLLALYSMIKKGKKWWLTIFAITGASMLLAEGIITPAISVSSAIEGLKINYPDLHTTPIVIGILLFLFFIQRFGTNVVGFLFGPIMLIWFLMIGGFGLVNILDNLSILKAINPIHAIDLLTIYPSGFWLLGAVFLCTTGAEALYSDLGHCSRQSIRIGWVFVKTCLLFNYFGQGAWILNNIENIQDSNFSPFYALIPNNLLIPSIIVSTLAAIIASQALISGSFSLINEASRLNLWPKMKTKYPASQKGQIYIPLVNLFLCVGCIMITYYFKESSNMEAAYGLAVVTTMINTTILFTAYLACRKYSKFIIYPFVTLYLTIESAFFIANLAKFIHGGWIIFLVGSALFFIMWVWYQAKILKRRYTKYSYIEDVTKVLCDLSNDHLTPKASNHLVYTTSSDDPRQIENKIIYSLLERRPKRANIYWFIHIEIVDEPYLQEYYVNILEPNKVVRIDFKLGFKIEPRINLFFKKVLKDLVNQKEINIVDRYEIGKKHNILGDISYVILKKYIANQSYLNLYYKIINASYKLINHIGISEDRIFGFDDEPSSIIVENVPMNIRSAPNQLKLKRVYKHSENRAKFNPKYP